MKSSALNVRHTPSNSAVERFAFMGSNRFSEKEDGPVIAPNPFIPSIRDRLCGPGRPQKKELQDAEIDDVGSAVGVKIAIAHAQ